MSSRRALWTTKGLVRYSAAPTAAKTGAARRRWPAPSRHRTTRAVRKTRSAAEGVAGHPHQARHGLALAPQAEGVAQDEDVQRGVPEGPVEALREVARGLRLHVPHVGEGDPRLGHGVRRRRRTRPRRRRTASSAAGGSRPRPRPPPPPGSPAPPPGGEDGHRLQRQALPPPRGAGCAASCPLAGRTQASRDRGAGRPAGRRARPVRGRGIGAGGGRVRRRYRRGDRCGRNGVGRRRHRERARALQLSRAQGLRSLQIRVSPGRHASSGRRPKVGPGTETAPGAASSSAPGPPRWYQLPRPRARSRAPPLPIPPHPQTRRRAR